jgi:hypothetical protein
VRRTDVLLAFAGRRSDGAYEAQRPDFPKEKPGPASDLRIVAHF